MLTVGSLCSGYEGIGLGLSHAGIEHRMVFVADPDKGATAVLNHHLEGVPNLGDITTVDWRTVAPVDLLSAGYPCQPFSTAGKRKGTTDVRHLWPHIADAVRVVRPRYVLLENVAGHRSLGFGRVLADLAALGYVGSWRSVRASDVGAAHKRERVFILAWREGDSPAVLFDGVAAVRPGGRGGADPFLSRLLPSPRTSDANGAGAHGDGGMDLRTAVTLLPSPKATDGRRNASEGELNRKSPALGAVAALLPSAVMLLPTPVAVDAKGARNATSGRKEGSGHHDGWTLGDIAHADRWGEFGPAIARWECVVGRPAPEPTELGANGKQRLSPRFVEWLMGLPAGRVTDVYLPDVDPRPVHLSRVQTLRLLGNGVVPQQLAHALRLLAGAA